MNPLQQGLRFLSAAFMGQELYRIDDELGTIIVTQRGDKRVLTFGSLMEQSSVLMSRPRYLNHEYAQMMLLGLIFVDANDVTIMGLGGGGLVHCLNHNYSNMNIRVVERRQAVIDVAYEWFNLPLTPQVQVNHGDALRYLCNDDVPPTDIIFSDLFEDRQMSEVQGHERYIRACRENLKDNGWLVMNFHRLPESGDPVMTALSTSFADIRACHARRGNWVLFCGKQSCTFDAVTLRQRAEALVQHVKMPLMNYYQRLQPMSTSRA